MNAALQTMVKGWCPGALRPMESGDGLIVRLKVTGGIVSTGVVAEIARWSRNWGNDQIDLTSRANLQIRGLTAPDLPRLRDAMAEWGLLDLSSEAEAVRNVIASPLAGLDPDAVLDIRPIVAEVERRLAGDSALHALPGKFGFAVDDGGRLGLGGVPADVMFRARRAGGEAVFDIGLDGAPDVSLGPIQPDAVSETAAVLGQAFLARRAKGGDIRRIRDWIRLEGAEPVADASGLTLQICPEQPPVLSAAYLSEHALGPQGEIRAFIGLGLLFGRINADALAHLAIFAGSLGGKELRLTPWRTILVPLPSLAPTGRGWREAPGEGVYQQVDTSEFEKNLPPAAPSPSRLGGPGLFLSPLGRGNQSALRATSFTLDPDDSLRRVAACVGAPACVRATTHVREDAARLAPLMPADKLLHVSGCAKGCAHPKPAAVTLVGRDGRYDLVRDGAPWDRPVAENLTVTEAADRLSVFFPAGGA